MRIFPKKIAIFGLGLIGGSIALGLKKHFGEKMKIFGLCQNFSHAQKAQKRGIIDFPLENFCQVPNTTELVIFALPLDATLEMFRKISRRSVSASFRWEKPLLLVDVASLKEKICREAWKVFSPPFFFLGTHPMAGGEDRGWENSRPDLFAQRPWIFCPKGKKLNSQEKIFWYLTKILGARPKILTPKEHDRLVAWASHLPLIISSLLMKVALSHQDWRKISKLTSTGFQDTTRLASHQPLLKTEIIFHNQKNLLPAISSFQKEIGVLEDLIKSRKKAEIFSYFQRIKLLRDNWLSDRKEKQNL